MSNSVAQIGDRDSLDQVTLQDGDPILGLGVGTSFRMKLSSVFVNNLHFGKFHFHLKQDSGYTR